jgi:hypothetical protein
MEMTAVGDASLVSRKNCAPPMPERLETERHAARGLPSPLHAH